jgi:hypothetical protein
MLACGMNRLRGTLLGRVALRFGGEHRHVTADLSAAARGAGGELWVAADERASLERLVAENVHVYGEHRSHDLATDLGIGAGDEVDVEGLTFQDDGAALFVVGSHSTKRKKPRGKDQTKDLERLATVKREAARFVLTRLPFARGNVLTGSKHPAASLPREGPDSLLAVLRDDEHLRSFLPAPTEGLPEPMLPGKDNGFDIEGLAHFHGRLLIGLRGPVLRGWAFVLELDVRTDADGTLRLASHGKRRYRKHALDLDGLGIRELLVHGDDLLVLAGPTMVLDGAHRLFRWCGGPAKGDDSLTGQAKGSLEPLFDIPFQPGFDRAEGLAAFSWFTDDDSVLVLYDAPSPTRCLDENTVLADVFAL